MSDFPTLSIGPNYPIKETPEDSTIQSEFDGGYTQTRPRFTRIRKTFELKYDNLISDSDKSALESFAETVKGGSLSFTWTHPVTSVSYTVRFKKTPEYEYVHYGWWKTSFTLVEV